MSEFDANIWCRRQDSAMPFQTWRAFPDDAIVQIRNAYGDTRIGLAKDFFWGYEEEMGHISEGTIIRARRLDRPLPLPPVKEQDQ